MTSAVVARPRLGSRRRVVRLGPAWLVDGVVALAALAISLVLASRHLSALRPGPGGLDAASVVLFAGTTVPLVAWRRSPRLVFVVTAGSSVLVGGLGYSIGVLVGPTIALYLWAASRDETHPWSARNTWLVATLLGIYVAASAVGDGGVPAVELLHNGLAFAVAWFAGERCRLRREPIVELEARASRAERELEQDRRLAVAEERARIARDLHDSVGHAINVIAVRAGAARLRHDQEPERSVTALAAIEEVARQTAEEIDHIVGALRDPVSDDHRVPAAPLGLASVPTLVARHTANGIEISLTRSGAPAVPDPAVDVAAYRILQEALTNVARHGTGPATVALTVGARALDLCVSNPVGGLSAPRERGAGFGLLGMRERVAMLDGTMDTGVVDDTFRVYVHLPYRVHRR